MAATAEGSDSVLPISTGVLYTAAGEERLVAIKVTNASTTLVRRVNLYLNRTGTNRPLTLDEDIPTRSHYNELTGHTMKTGDTIQGDVDAGTDAHYIISTVRLS
jgi:hypothetical protein